MLEMFHAHKHMPCAHLHYIIMDTYTCTHTMTLHNFAMYTQSDDTTYVDACSVRVHVTIIPLCCRNTILDTQDAIMQ